MHLSSEAEVRNNTVVVQWSRWAKCWDWSKYTFRAFLEVKMNRPAGVPFWKVPRNVRTRKVTLPVKLLKTRFVLFFVVFVVFFSHENFRPENLMSSSPYDLLALKSYRKGFPTFSFSNKVAKAVALFVHIWRLSHYMKMMEKKRRRARHREELRSGLQFQTFASSGRPHCKYLSAVRQQRCSTAQ